ncbi:unnamed protein product [Linum trigynum]|uniref:Uncharacterized protein n=1 Tax=Linum trigynum TaxID=586398 RepID=A0AAV2G8P6_9ROSI
MAAPDATSDIDTASPVVPYPSPVEDVHREDLSTAESSFTPTGSSTEPPSSSSLTVHPSPPSSAVDTSPSLLPTCLHLRSLLSAVATGCDVPPLA